jgi:exosortase/archaeosortase family protein
MVLVITAVLAGYLFLRSGWKRALLVVFVVPLAIVRNGFRIFVIGELCVHVSHEMINSPIHHKGGPIFFALSLIPFFALLIWLRKSEHYDSKTVGAAGGV